jgi:hypothetical protein
MNLMFKVGFVGALTFFLGGLALLMLGLIQASIILMCVGFGFLVLEIIGVEIIGVYRTKEPAKKEVLKEETKKPFQWIGDKWAEKNEP